MVNPYENTRLVVEMFPHLKERFKRFCRIRRKTMNEYITWFVEELVRNDMGYTMSMSPRHEVEYTVSHMRDGAEHVRPQVPASVFANRNRAA